MTNRTKELTLIALFPALMGATAGISIPLLFGFPPVTLQTFFVLLAGLMLGPKKGALSMLIYLLMGAIGMPVFAGYTGGLGIILGRTGGFLIGFVLAAFFVGVMKTVKFINNEYIHHFVILVGANVIIYMCGASYMAYVTNTNTWLVLGYFPTYFIGDFLKIIASLYVYSRIRSVITYEYA